MLLLNTSVAISYSVMSNVRQTSNGLNELTTARVENKIIEMQSILMKCQHGWSRLCRCKKSQGKHFQLMSESNCTRIAWAIYIQHYTVCTTDEKLDSKITEWLSFDKELYIRYLHKAVKTNSLVWRWNSNSSRDKVLSDSAEENNFT